MNLRLRLSNSTFAIHVKKSIHKYLNNQAGFQRLICLSQLFAVIFLYCISVGGADQSSSPEILIQNGHTGKLTAIAYSPLGTLFVTGGNDYIVKLWDEKNGQLQNNFVGHSGVISSLAFSRNGELVISGSHDGTVRLWSVKSGKQVRVFVGHKSHVLSVAFSPDSKFIASAGGSFEGTSDRSIRIWETQTGRLLSLLEGHKQKVNSIAFSPDGELLASGSDDAEIKIWSKTGAILKTFENIDNENPRPTPRRPGVKFIVFSPDGRSFATLDSSVLKIRNTRDGSTSRVIKLPTDVFNSFAHATFSPDWKQVFILPYNDDDGYLFSVDDGRLIQSLEAKASTSRRFIAAFSNDGKRILIGWWGTVDILDARTLKCVDCIPNTASETTSASFSPNGSLLTWVSNCKVNLWDLKAGRLVDIPVNDESSCITAITFSPDGKTLVTGGSQDSVKVFSVSDHKMIESLPEPNWSPVIAYSPDGRLIAWASEPSVGSSVLKLWDRQNNRIFRTTPIPDTVEYTDVEADGVDLAIAFSHDGKLVAAGGDSQVVRVWEVQTGKLIYELKGHNYPITSISFSENGETIATASTDLRIWNAKNGQLINSFGNHTDMITMVALSPDSKTIASASKDRTIKLWELPNGKFLQSFDGHYSKVNSVAFSPDGSTLISSSADATTRLWSVNTGDWLVSLVTLGEKEWVAFTPDSYFKASDGVASSLKWRVDAAVYDIAKYRSQFYKPEIVVKRSLGLLPSITTATISTTTAPVPVVKNAASSIVAAEESLRRRFEIMQYSALVIGNGSYQFLDSLKTPVKDAEDVATVLKESYDFNVKLLRNATREQILDALDTYRRLDDNSSLLIYYAGHGTYEQDTGVTYWQPVDARPNRSSAWISADDVVSRIRGIKARHLLIVVDSCFSGGIFDSHLSGGNTDEEPVQYLVEMMEHPSRFAMTSTDRDYIDDVGEDGHTVFTHRFIQGLKFHKNNIFTVDQLFNKFIKDRVISNSYVNQRPQYGPIPNSLRLRGANTGNFIFIRKPR